MQLNHDDEVEGMRNNARELLAKLPRLIDATPDDRTHEALERLTYSLKEFLCLIDDPATDPPQVDDDPDTDPPMVEDDPDTDPDEAFIGEDDEPVTADEHCVMKQRPDIRPMIKLFTLNDRYRFRRELFGNLDAAMAEALETLSVMSDITQARTYLEDDLCWDMTLPEVEEFVAAITPYYSTGRL